MRYTTPCLLLALLSTGAAAVAAEPEQAGISPWGPKDEIGRLNLMTPASRSAILRRVSGQNSYDLAVDLYVGMPSWQEAGDPPYQMWMTHTPHGNVVADSMKVGEKMNRHVSYTGSAVSMYAHMGTHIDALNHFGLNGKIWNGFSEAEYLGDRGWTVTGAETLPPIVARGVLIDVAAAKGLQQLPANYRITRRDLRDALDLQGVKMEQGDVVLIRTGRMRDYRNAQVYMANPPGLSIDGAKFLVEDGGAMVVGADNLSLETFPSEVTDNYLPVHTYLLAQQGAPIIEMANLEALARDRVYQFAFIGASIKFRGGDAAPIRPIALPLKEHSTTRQRFQLINPAGLYDPAPKVGCHWRRSPAVAIETTMPGRTSSSRPARVAWARVSAPTRDSSPSVSRSVSPDNARRTLRTVARSSCPTGVDVVRGGSGLGSPAPRVQISVSHRQRRAKATGSSRTSLSGNP